MSSPGRSLWVAAVALGACDALCPSDPCPDRPGCWEPGSSALAYFPEAFAFERLPGETAALTVRIARADGVGVERSATFLLLRTVDGWVFDAQDDRVELPDPPPRRCEPPADLAFTFELAPYEPIVAIGERGTLERVCLWSETDCLSVVTYW